MASSSPSPHGWHAPSPAELAGVLTNYEVTALIGQGGMGAVYRAMQPNLDRDVAIKILPMELAVVSAEDLQFAERFEQEAKSMAKLSHPGIIKVYDFGEAEFSGGKFLYFVMEFVRGRDIHQYLHEQGGRLEAEHAHAVVCHVLDALGFAHRHGIVHRDIKPANIMLDEHGRVKVADFGLAKSTTHDMGLTMTNLAMGTPDYVAPEALDSEKEVDGRADLYAVGAMLYQLLTGTVPRGVFRPASELVEGVDARYDEIIGKALQPDPDDRYADATEFRVALDKIMAGPPTAEMKKTRPVDAQQAPVAVNKAGGGRGAMPKLVGIGVLGIGLLVGALLVNRQPEEKKQDTGTEVPQNSAAVRTEEVATIPGDEADSAAAGEEPSREHPLENSLGMRFVPVEITGGPTDTATSGRTVWFSIWETRRSDYNAFVEATGREWAGQQPRKGKEGWDKTPDHPAGQISWEDATAFCEWLTATARASGAIPEDAVYRLPSDHEWSCAAGIGKDEDPVAIPADKNMQIDKLPWGEAWPPPAGFGNYFGEELDPALLYDREPIKEYSDPFPRAAPVGSFAADAAGLHDLSGNVWEFCQDVNNEVAQPDRRVARGGGWDVNDATFLNLSRRNGVLQSQVIQGAHIGFRCVLETPAGAALASRQEGLSAAPSGDAGEADRDTGAGKPAIVVVAARYGFPGDPAMQVDVTARLIEALRRERGRVEVRNALAGKDPAPNKSKKLELDYTLGGEQRSLTVDENKTLDLSEGEIVLSVLEEGMAAGELARNETGMELRWIPAGKFIMGSPQGEQGHQAAEKQVEVELTHGFWLGSFEVTQEQYEKIVGSNPSRFKELGGRAPVEQMNWHDAVAFCEKLTEIERAAGKLPDGWAYYLPTEAQWEYACRAGEAGPYAGGELDDVGWFKENSGERTHLVGEKKPNAWGLHDMHGNAWEWCADYFAEKLPGGQDPMGPAEGDHRVLRGGGWPNDANSARSARRRHEPPWRRGYALGLRVVAGPLRSSSDPGGAVVEEGAGPAGEAKPVEPVEPAPVAEPEPEPEPFAEVAAIPGLQDRLAAYLAARRKQVDALAEKYGGAVDRGLNQAADAGDLRSVTACREEKANVVALREELANKPEDVVAAVLTLVNLPPQPAGSSGMVTGLRKLWNGQIAKIDGQLDPALGQSLQLLEGELTRARKPEDAQRLMAFRKALTARGRDKSGAGEDTANPAGGEETASIPGQWISLFNGRNLDGWKMTGIGRPFTVSDQCIKVSGNPAMLYYTGDAGFNGRFRDFDFRAEVKTQDGGKSGVFFHTAEEGAGVPIRGYEVEIYNGSGESGKTGGLGEIVPLDESPAVDREWFKLEISVRGMEIIVKVDGREVARWREPSNHSPPSAYRERRLREGTFALQCEFAQGGVTWFRNVQVRPWTDALTVACKVPEGRRIERALPDLRSLPKGRIFAWGIGEKELPIDISEHDRGNDFVRVYAKQEGRWWALRARGSITTPDKYHKNFDDVADFSLTGGHGGPVVVFKDSTAARERRDPGLTPGMRQGTIVDGAAGNEVWAVLDEDGRVGGNVGMKWEWGWRLPPLGPTDIIALSFGHRTCWCLRANGQVTWFGRPPKSELPASENRNIAILEGSSDTDHVLALTRDGKVLAWGGSNEFGELDVPEAARSGMQAVRVCHRGGISAARGRNGKWIAWGNDKEGVVSKINSLGPDVVDLAFTDRHLLWIE